MVNQSLFTHRLETGGFLVGHTTGFTRTELNGFPIGMTVTMLLKRVRQNWNRETASGESLQLAHLSLCGDCSQMLFSEPKIIKKMPRVQQTGLDFGETV